MELPDNFAVFILSHGRPDKVDTFKTLQKAGYTGRLYIIIDNEDKQAARYYENFGDRVIMFDKAAIAETFDEGDNFQDRRAVIYARNACFEIAPTLGVEWFMQLDDDYFNICYKIDESFEYVNSFMGSMLKDANLVIRLLLNYYQSTKITSLAIAQGGDYIGGKYNPIHEEEGRRRKAMNTFICSTQRQFRFVGRINEDVNTYTRVQNTGALFLTFPLLAIQQRQTQQNTGGMSEMYLESGTYIKSFYTVMYQPSSVKVKMMGETNRRLHHSIKWDNTVPCIIRESHRKKASKPERVKECPPPMPA